MTTLYTDDLLLEIGTEELPPKALKNLSNALTQALESALQQAKLPFLSITGYATPRRLAVMVTQLASQQPDQTVERRGPALKAAFDAAGQPTKALLGFAQSCGVEVAALQRQESDKGAWLVYQSLQAGKQTVELLPAMIESAIQQLPIPKRMRWGDLEAEFVRPVHWLTVLYGSKVVPMALLAQQAGRVTRGHRFMAPDLPLTLQHPNDYLEMLLAARVVADFEQRRQMVSDQVKAAAQAVGGRAVVDDDLLDEVTAMVEWPVAVTGSFEEAFLAVPAECLISAMKGHQKYFHLVDEHGQLLPRFITISNIVSRQPQLVQQGNERVIRPRLADAAFFWHQDQKQPLASRFEQLKTVVFQQQLGTLKAKSERLMELIQPIATTLELDPAQAQLAAQLAKCDLLTDMVFEFPELQGVMGMHYARAEGLAEAVATALNAIYQPRFATDRLPEGRLGAALAVADRIDTLVGIFATGQKPTGTKDPFGLRRAAVALLRLTIELKLPLNLRQLLDRAAAIYLTQLAIDSPLRPQLSDGRVAQECYDYILDRCSGYFAEQQIEPAVTAAVVALKPEEPLDLARRIEAVRHFQQLPEATTLAAAYKRITNLLKKSGLLVEATVNPALFQQTAEEQLWQQIQQIAPLAEAAFAQRDYSSGLQQLATLKTVIDTFFTEVMVMSDDLAIRHNRLTLLQQIQTLFSQVADLAALPLGE